MGWGELILGVHAGATLSMVGLIWFVQVVHYPLYLRVGEDAFHGYHQEHMARTTAVVAPLMLTELGTAAWLVLGNGPVGWLSWTGLGLVVVVWLSTAAIQIPQHRRLERGFDAAVARSLVRGNWIRTVAWTLRGALAVALLAIH